MTEHINELGITDLDGERGPAQLDDTKRTVPRGARAFLWLTGLAAVAVTAGVFISTLDRQTAQESQSLESTRSGITNRLAAPRVSRTPPQSSAALVVPAPEPTPSPVPVIINRGLTLPDDTTARRLRSPLRADSEPPTEGMATTSTPASGPMRDSGPLADKLRPLELAPSVAGQLGDRNFLITQGTMIDCTLQTRLVSTHAGLLTCLATHDVMSANGKVKLIDRGTKFTGYQSGGIVQGQARAFITWNRLETPMGVILNLASPGTGALGEAGIDGHVDNHFWDRFGNAILLSLMGDLGNWASSQGQQGDNNIRFDTTREGGQEVVAKILEHSLDIPPTLYKNQGERIGIMVARDLDFNQVYDLKPTSNYHPLR
ncbi:TrbI/VirB10 family protein [Allopusillimonas ginsengisoli]|nr:TrbI/VirB10 family protein [Allopusillimonas ginsengisoli]